MAFTVLSGVTAIANATLTDPRPLLMNAGYSFENDTPNATPPEVTFDCNQTGSTLTASSGTIPSGTANLTTYQLSLVSGSLPTALTAGNFYYLSYVSASTFQLKAATASEAASTTAAISITAVTGQAKLKAIGMVWSNARTNSFPPANLYGRNTHVLGFNFSSLTDLSTDLFSLPMQFTDLTSTNIGRMWLIDQNGHWARFKTGDSTHLMLTPAPQCVYNLSDYTTLPTYNTRSSSSFDITKITKVLVSSSTSNTNTRISIGIGSTNINRLTTMVLSGSGTLADVVTAMNASHPMSVDYGNSVFRIAQPIQLGNDGTNALSLTDENATIFFPAGADGVNTFIFNLYPNDIALRVKPGASDTFSLTNTQIKGVDSWIFDTDSTATPGTFSLAGNTVIGAATTFGNYPHSNFAVVSGTSCAQNGSTLTSVLYTDTTLLVDDPDLIVNCSFTSGGTGHGMEISVAGTYDFSSTFSGYGADGTTDAAVYNNSGGSLTLNLSGSTPIPTVRNGAGASTTFTRNVLVTAPNLLDNTRVQLYNVTQAVELDNSVVSGGSGYSVTVDLNSVDVSNGDTLRLRATYTNGVTAKLPLDTSGVVTASGLSFISTQEDWTVYNGWGLDGSSYVTKFTADYVNDEIDIIIGSNFALNELGSWWAYNLTTEDGIRNFFGGFEFDDDANLRNVNSVVSVKLDNTTATNIWQTDNRRLYRDDNTRPVRNPTSGGGGIDVEWRSPVSLANIDSFTTSISDISKLIRADEIHNLSAGIIEKREEGTATVLLTKNFTGRGLVDFQAIKP